MATPALCLRLGREFRRHSLEGDRLRTGAACMLAAVVQEAFSEGLTGLEFAVGIPGTVGGALAMNAGSREEWIGSVVESVTLFVPGPGLVGVRGPEIAWGYRVERAARRAASSSRRRFALVEGDADRIRRAMEASLSAVGSATQPLSMPSAGSVFVNPEATRPVA